jgi:exopolyphosphatase/guanosine-5'-triphosphate,3'-diphosphate pyrophosphatase
MTLRELRELTDYLRQLDYGQRCRVPGMSDRRAEIIVSGAVILQEAMTLLGLQSIVACSRALREGIVVDWMLTHGLISDRLRYQSSIRQRSALMTAQKYRVHLESSNRVANFALSLFDQTAGVLHQWQAQERGLLWAAAILHNCGHYVSHSSHHKHSYYLIRHGGLLGYTDAEIETIANIARYHRKSTPRKKHENYRNLPVRNRQIVDQLSVLLRLAVALDRRQVGAIQALRCEYQPHTRTLNLRLLPTNADDDCVLELWSLTLKKEAFESEFGLKLTAELLPQDTTIAEAAGEPVAS